MPTHAQIIEDFNRKMPIQFTDAQGFTLSLESITDIAFYKNGRPDGGIEDPHKHTIAEIEMILAGCRIAEREYVFNTGFPVVMPARLASK